jgi:hypothetical protein
MDDENNDDDSIDFKLSYNREGPRNEACKREAGFDRLRVTRCFEVREGGRVVYICIYMRVVVYICMHMYMCVCVGGGGVCAGRLRVTRCLEARGYSNVHVWDVCVGMCV